MDHWNRLRAAIADRGLSALVSETGQAAVANLKSEIVDGPSIDNFDPLMGAHNAILGNAIQITGPVLLMASGDDEPCPLCYLNESLAKHHAEGCTTPGCLADTLPPGHYDDWIDKAADGAAEEWKRRGAQV
jgi:hypothetical protein